jgi:outer membrane protein TolC
VTQEELAHDNLKKQEEALQQQISLEVWDGHSALVEAQERVQSTLTFVANAQENLLIAEGQYREGVGTMLEVTDAQTDLLTAEQSHIEALVDQKIAVASLARAVGNREIKEKGDETEMVVFDWHWLLADPGLFSDKVLQPQHN